MLLVLVVVSNVVVLVVVECFLPSRSVVLEEPKSGELSDGGHAIGAGLVERLNGRATS